MTTPHNLPPRLYEAHAKEIALIEGKIAETEKRLRRQKRALQTYLREIQATDTNLMVDA